MTGRQRSPRRRGDRDGGAATVLVLCLAAVLVVAAGVVTATVAATVVRHRLAAVADAAALAAAARAQDPAGACATAGTVASANGAVLVGCRLAGPIATVAVTARHRGLWAWMHPPTLNSRAGPAETNTEQPGQAASAS